MYMRFECLEGVTTLSGTVSGECFDWKVTVTAPGNITTEDTTGERQWFTLWSELVTAAFKNANKRRSLTAGPPLAAGNGTAKP
jgi:hypothetical protein